MSNTYTLRSVAAAGYTEKYPFQLKIYTGTPISNDRPSYYLNSGYCFSTFNYDKKTCIPISDFNQPFELTEQDAVYIDFKVLPNLQVSGATIKVGPVGPDAPADGWQDYPASYKIRPTDILDADGRVKTFVDGKRQENHYLLVGYCTKDLSEDGIIMTNNDVTFKYVPCVKDNVIMMMSNVSGVPVVFTMPYFKPVTIEPKTNNN